jgi:hypothetical protein
MYTYKEEYDEQQLEMIKFLLETEIQEYTSIYNMILESIRAVEGLEDYGLSLEYYAADGNQILAVMF